MPGGLAQNIYEFWHLVKQYDSSVYQNPCGISTLYVTFTQRVSEVTTQPQDGGIERG